MNYLGLAFGILIVGVIVYLWSMSKPATGDEMPLYIEGFALIGYNHDLLTRNQARLKAEELDRIRDAVLEELQRIYEVDGDCVINTVVLDPEFYKPAEWSKVHARVLWVNPTKRKHRSHFAEEIHNCFRIGQFGDAHRYEPVDDHDAAMREQAQSFCRGF